MASNSYPTETNLSPHTLQNKDSKYCDGIFTKKNRILSIDSPSAEYRPSRKDDQVTTCHYGRRQLLINEIEFLILSIKSLHNELKDDIISKKILVVYAGASEGQHLLILSEFFPFIKFILYDPKRVYFTYGNKRLKSNFEVYEENLNGEKAELIKAKYNDEDNWIRLFISDIRRSNDNEKIVQEDMDIQQEIYYKLDPFKSYLKFRLPYIYNTPEAEKQRNAIKEYLEGDIYFLIWGPSHTSETRLVVSKKASTKLYLSELYENQLFNFNSIQRTWSYWHDIKSAGIDHCYDCRSECFVFEQYIDNKEILEKLNERRIFSYNNISRYIEMVNKMIESEERYLKYRLSINGISRALILKFTDIMYGKTKSDLINIDKQNNEIDRVANKFKKLNFKS